MLLIPGNLVKKVRYQKEKRTRTLIGDLGKTAEEFILSITFLRATLIEEMHRKDALIMSVE